MKKLFPLVLLFTLFAVPSFAQDSTPVPTTTITVGTIYAGHTALPNLYCYSLPLTIGGVSGTAWIDVQGQGGFILFRPNLEGTGYVTAQITSVTGLQLNKIGQVTSMTVAFQVVADPDNDNDSDTVQGSITIMGLYVYGGSGRIAGWYLTITGGSGTQSTVLG